MKNRQPSKFFKTLYQFCEGNQIEFRCLPSRKQIFVPLEDSLKLPDFHGSSQDIYFGVATRNGGGTKDHIVQIPAAWCDLDFKGRLEDGANEKIKHFPLKPSIIIDSGGGYHLYWIFKEPLAKKDISNFEIILKRIATYFEGDMASTEAARVLRVPETLNLKYQPLRRIKIIDINPEIAYELDDFDTVLPEIKTSQIEKCIRQNELGWQNEALRGVGEGMRNDTATKLAGRYIAKGLSDEEATAILVNWNEKNKPPLQKKEIIRTIESVRATHERNHGPEIVCETNKQDLMFPEHIMAGVAKEFAELYVQYLESPLHFFYLAFLACLGSVLSTTLKLKTEARSEPRIYLVLIGETSVDRKSTTISKTIDFFREIDGLDFHVCFGANSAEGVARMLKNQEVVLLAYDELKQFTSKAGITNSSLLPMVNTLFEETRYEGKTKTGNLDCPNAHLTFLAASTIDTYQNTWTEQFTDIGFNNRLFIATGRGKRKFAFPKKIPFIKQKQLQEEARIILNHVGEGLELDIEPEAGEIFQEWYMNLDRSIHAKRLEGYALRWMGLLAVNELKGVIDVDIVKKAIDLCDWQLKVRKEYDPLDADSAIGRMEMNIQKQLRQRGELSDAALRKYTNAHKGKLWEYKKALGNLKELEIINTRKVKGKPYHQINLGNMATIGLNILSHPVGFKGA